MDRRVFIRQTAVAALGGLVAFDLSNALAKSEMAFAGKGEISPRAITMWDFSWLERRWPGAGYEDWDQVLDELSERGYNAIRIDAYPHLIAENPMKKWLLKEVWNQQDWGSPDMNEVQVQPNLNLFLSKCKERDIKVGLSSWYRLDVDEVCLKLDTPEKLADCWLTTLRSIEEDGLLDTILYVDLCNEWPGDSWAPFFAKTYPNVGWGNWYKEESLRWMKTSFRICHSYILLIMGMSRNMKRWIALFLICMSIIFGWPNRMVENFISWWDMATIVFYRMIIRMW